MGAAWWLLAVVAAVAAWALLEMLRWRIRHNRLLAQLTDRAELNAPVAVTGPLTKGEYDRLVLFNSRRYSVSGAAVTWDKREMAALQARYNAHGAAWMGNE